MREQYIDKDDGQIVKEIQEGNLELFEIIVERYTDKLTRYGRRLLFNTSDLEDHVQDIFLKVYKNLQSYDPERKFSSWIYRIAHNEFINAGVKKSSSVLEYFDFDKFIAHPIAKEQPDKELLQKELTENLESCVNKLDSKYKEPVVLYYLEGLSYEEISNILQIPIATVGVRLNRGRAKLEQLCNKLKI